jgi:hypothetical protein
VAANEFELCCVHLQLLYQKCELCAFVALYY